METKYQKHWAAFQFFPSPLSHHFMHLKASLLNKWCRVFLVRAVLGNRLLLAEANAPTSAWHEIPNPRTTMKAEGILLVVKYLRTVSRQLGIMTLSLPGRGTSLPCGYPPNYCGLVQASPHLTVLAFSSHRISSSRSNRMHTGDTAC